MATAKREPSAKASVAVYEGTGRVPQIQEYFMRYILVPALFMVAMTVSFDFPSWFKSNDDINYETVSVNAHYSDVNVEIYAKHFNDVSTLGINMGFIFTWPASTMLLFASENTTLNRPMTETEMSLLANLSSVGGLISTLTAGFLLDKLGRKRCSIVTSISLVFFWVVLSVCKQVEVVLFCIFISGICSSVFLTASVYISEIAQESIRGSMTAANVTSYGIGGLLLFGLSGCLSYDTVLYIGVTMTVCSTISLLLIKDSPTYLLQIGKEKEAAESIAFYKQLKVTDKQVMDDINTIKRTINGDLNDSTPEVEKLNPDLEPHKKLSFWQFMKKSQSSRRALLVNIILLLSSIFQGLMVVQTYIQPLVVQEIPTSSPVVCSIVMAAVSVGASLAGAYLTDVAGRRPLIIYGSIGAGISCVVLGTQMHFHWGPEWIILVFLYIFPVMYTLGAGTVPTVIMAEVFLPEVKSILSMVVMEIMWICIFIALFIFLPIINAIGWGPVFYIFATICFATAIFSFYLLPETKGLTVEEIQLLFTKRKNRQHC